MARPKIDDNQALLEIAVIMNGNSQPRFSRACSIVLSHMNGPVHSEGSRRRRLQRKFKEDRDMWMQRGADERLNRIGAQIAMGIHQFSKQLILWTNILARSDFMKSLVSAKRALNQSGLTNHLAEALKTFDAIKHHHKPSLRMLEQNSDKFKQPPEFKH